MKKYLLLSFMLMFAFVYSDTWAQQRTISGNVTSVEDGSALPGVNVVLKGSTAGTVTDIDGNYSLSVPTEGGTLVFSFIGLASEEVEIGSRSVVDIQMTADVKQLSEVVVVGFGTQSKRNLTSSIVSVGSEDIQNVSVQGFEQAIQGRMAGVNITGASGTLGASQAIRVRGVSSINASNQPLFVVDGIPMTNDDTNLGGAALGGPGTNPLINLNPNDIESIEVLKDAASAAIYGSRGTNGVILITTKRGKAGKTNIGVNYYAGFSDPTTDFDLLSGPEYQRLKNYGNFQRFGNDYFDPVEDDSFQNTQDAPNADHIDAITRTAFVHEASLSATGGNEKTKFYAGATYRDEEGYVLTTRLKRYSGRINIDHALSDKVKLEFGINPSRTENQRQSEDNNIASPYTIGALARPDIPLLDDDGTPTTSNLFGSSPLADVLARTRLLTTTQVLSNINLDWEVFPGLNLRSEFGIEYTSITERQRLLPDASVEAAPGGSAFANFADALNYNWNGLALYYFELDEHSFEITAGANIQVAETAQFDVTGDTFASEELKTLESAANITAGGGIGTEYRFVGFLGRVNYNYGGKYLFSVSGRYDGSSRFGEDNRFGFFPAVSGGWILSDEAFLSDLGGVDLLKVRASYGLTGNAEIGNFASRGLVTFGRDYNAIPGFEITQISNPNLTWEETAQLDVAVEFGFLGRIRGSVGWFNKTTTELLLNVPYDLEVGINTTTAGSTSTLLQNAGELRNRGFELELSADIIKGNDFQWTASLNAATINNEVLSLVDTDGDGEGNEILGNTTIIREGDPIRAFYVVPYAGVDPENGDALFLDESGEATNVFNTANRRVMGDAFPDVFGGLTNTFNYKGIDLTAFIQYSVGQEQYYDDGRFIATQLAAGFGGNRSQLGAWTPLNTNTNIPEARSASNGNQRSSRYLQDASYARLKTLTLGYTLPKKLTKNVSVRVYAQGQNVFTITSDDYEGLDPESSTNDDDSAVGGLTFFSRPQSRTFTFGVNVNF